MRNKISFVSTIILTILFFLSFPIHSEVYKWTDENGKTHFGDKPPETTEFDQVDIKNINTIKKASEDPLAGTYKKDFFVMPARKSTVPYRFFLASKMQGKKPADRLKNIKINDRQRRFIIYVDLSGVEQFEEYNLRSRIIDAKGELVFDKTASITTHSNSIFFYNSYTPKVTADAPGTWTFQGILNDRTLYNEKRKIEFYNPNKEKTGNALLVAKPTGAGTKRGTTIPSPRTPAGYESLFKKEKATVSATSSITGTTKVIPRTKTPPKTETEETSTCHDPHSVGCSKNIPVITDKPNNSHINNTVSTIMDTAIPVPTAATLYQECDTKNLKPGTSRSSRCDLWDKHIKYLNQRMEKVCKNAGEEIYQTASNVDGVFLNAPLKDPNNPKRSFKNNDIHTSQSRSLAGAYVSPGTARLYRQFEYYSNRKKAFVTNKITGISKGSRVAKIDKTNTESLNPESRFEVSYKHLTTDDDHKQGFYGDFTWVKDRETGKIMAERTIYYYAMRERLTMEDGSILLPPAKRGYKPKFFYPCENYVPRITRFEEHHPKDEYEFVSRVLTPVTFSQSENNALYHFSVGNGERKRDCVGMRTLGPKINPSNLIVTRVEDDLKLSIKGNTDSYTCQRFFSGPHWDLKLLFADGGMWEEPRVLAHGNIDWVKD
jgi:Domain of unknown function (DUF4124)